MRGRPLAAYSHLRPFMPLSVFYGPCNDTSFKQNIWF